MGLEKMQIILNKLIELDTKKQNNDVQGSIKSYLELLTPYFIENVKVDYKHDETVKTRLHSFAYYYSHMPNNIKFYLDEFTKKLDCLYFKNFENLKLKNLNIDNLYLYEQSFEFFKDLNPKFKFNLDKIYTDKLIRVLDKNDPIYKISIDCMNRDTYYKIPYGTVKNSKKCSVISTYNHETMHMIEHMENFDHYSKKNAFFLREINSTFVDYLTDYLYINKNDENSFEHLKSWNNYFNDVRHYLLDLGILFTLVPFIQKQKIHSSSIKKTLINRYNYPTNDILEYIKQIDPYYTTLYLFSSIVALHLLEIYKEDPYKAKFLLNKNIYSSNNGPIQMLKDLEFDYRDVDYGVYLFQQQDIYFQKHLTYTKKKP